MARTLDPDVALVDLDLGREDGADVAMRLSAEAPGTKVVLISAYDHEAPDELVRATGAAAFLSKTALGTGALEGLVA